MKMKNPRELYLNWVKNKEVTFRYDIPVGTNANKNEWN